MNGMGVTASRMDPGAIAKAAVTSMEGNGDGGGGYVRLVHPRGKVVQVRGPVRAGDVMRSTKHYVTKPNVFRVPPESAVLRPDAILMPGHKFFLVPCSTMVKLVNRHHGQHSKPSSSSSSAVHPTGGSPESTSFDLSSACYNAPSPSSSLGSPGPDNSCLQLRLGKSKPKPPPKHKQHPKPRPSAKERPKRNSLADILQRSGDGGDTSDHRRPLEEDNGRKRLPPRPPPRIPRIPPLIPPLKPRKPLWKPKLPPLVECSPEASASSAASS